MSFFGANLDEYKEDSSFNKRGMNKYSKAIANMKCYDKGWNDAIDACIEVVLTNEKDKSVWKVLQELKIK